MKTKLRSRSLSANVKVFHCTCFVFFCVYNLLAQERVRMKYGVEKRANI